MNQTDYFSLKFLNDKLVFLDQTKLPFDEKYIESDDYNRIAEAIERLEIRGAPLIGIAAAYALALSVKSLIQPEKIFLSAYERLASTRPTAVNLFFALDEMKNHFDKTSDTKNIYDYLLKKAEQIHKADEEFCRKIGHHGLSIFKKKSNVLTHCNTGRLATGGDGTAFNVIKTAYENGLVNFVYADETRPLLQGSRLTAFELEKNGIPFSLQTESSAAELMKQNKVDFVITGADRIAINGDTANKIGTYTLAILCNFHNIPFYIAAPSTTIDRNILTGSDISIEYRNKSEVLSFNEQKVTSENYEVFSPAFDVTPSYLITAIITEAGVYSFPFNFLI